MRIDKPGVHGELRTIFSKLKKVGRQSVSNPGPLPPRATTSPLHHHRCPCCRLYLDGSSLRCRSNLGATEMHLRTFLSLLDQTKEKVWITLMIFLTLCQLSRETKRKKRFKLEKHLIQESRNNIEHFFRYMREGCAVAEWSNALLLREEVNKNQNIPGLPPSLGHRRKALLYLFCY